MDANPRRIWRIAAHGIEVLPTFEIALPIRLFIALASEILSKPWFSNDGTASHCSSLRFWS